MIVSAVSFALSAALTAIVMSLYGQFLPLFSLPGILIVCALTFLLCRYIDRHRLAGTLLLIVLFFLMSLLFRLLLTAGNQQSGLGFREWMLTRGEDASFCLMYVISMVIGAGFFFSTTIYYFSIVRYRISFLSLLSLMPCILYAKVIADIDNLCLLIIAGLNLLLHIVICQQNVPRDRGHIPRSSAPPVLCLLPAAGLFIFFVLLVCAALPKEEEARYYDRFEALFLGETGGDTGLDDYSKLSDFSGNADRFSDMTSRRLYNIEGPTSRYYRRQTFDLYDFEKDRWSSLTQSENGMIPVNDWRSYNLLLSWASFQEAVRHAKALEPSFPEKYGLEALCAAPDFEDPVSAVRIQPVSFTPSYLLASPFNVAAFSADIENVNVTPSGTFLYKSDLPEGTVHASSYAELFYDRNDLLSDWIQMGVPGKDPESSEKMLRELTAVLEKADDPLLPVAEAFLRQLKEAGSYQSSVQKNTEQISRKLRGLSDELTKDASSDLEKASAILRYFYDNDFIYDTSYLAGDTSPEYFLFRSKRGSCSDYASAYVLLARAAGLTVRYAEGFMAEKTSRDNHYVIRNTGSHAWPEVYLPNTGWVIFEPTVGREESIDRITDWGERILGMLPDSGLVGMIVTLAVIIGLCILLIRLLIPLFSELFFRIRLHFIPVERCPALIYQRLLSKMEERQKGSAFKRRTLPEADLKAMTVREFGSFLGWDEFKPFAALLEKNLYAPPDPPVMQRDELIRFYRKAFAFLRKHAFHP